jgi:hypothetical protein
MGWELEMFFPDGGSLGITDPKAALGHTLLVEICDPLFKSPFLLFRSTNLCFSDVCQIPISVVFNALFRLACPHLCECFIQLHPSKLNHIKSIDDK